MHFGTFPLADDGMEEPVNELLKLKEQKGNGNDEFMVLQEGEVFGMR
jgi:hypothetical protein